MQQLLIAVLAKAALQKYRHCILSRPLPWWVGISPRGENEKGRFRTVLVFRLL